MGKIVNRRWVKVCVGDREECESAMGKSMEGKVYGEIVMYKEE
jgi:hypothetical protein